MAFFLAGKRILLGVTGSIAVYKSVDLVRRLREEGASVRVTMTKHAKQFITPLTLQAVSGHPVHDDLFDLQAEAAMGHIELARWADVILVAPASAGFMARLARGLADDLLTTLCLASRAPLVIAPAMNQGMWQHPLTQENARLLKQNGVRLLGPAEGSQACGETGPGRMMEPEDIITHLSDVFAGDALSGVRVLVTAGPTQEPIDPIRFITNPSSGKMGFAMAIAAREAGADVTLISGPVVLPPPKGTTYLPVVSAKEMHQAVMRKVIECDIFLAVAAVGDYRAETVAPQKLHKDEETLSLRLVRNPDIVSQVGQLVNKPFIVGFAAETEDVIARAKLKRERKNMDMIVANQVGGQLGMGCDDNAVTVIGPGWETTMPLAPKDKLARDLITLIGRSFHERPQHHEGNDDAKRSKKNGI